MPQSGEGCVDLPRATVVSSEELGRRPRLVLASRQRGGRPCITGLAAELWVRFWVSCLAWRAAVCGSGQQTVHRSQAGGSTAKLTWACGCWLGGVAHRGLGAVGLAYKRLGSALPCLGRSEFLWLLARHRCGRRLGLYAALAGFAGSRSPLAPVRRQPAQERVPALPCTSVGPRLGRRV